MDEATERMTELTAEIVAAFVSNNSVRPVELPELIAHVHSALATITAPKPLEEPAPELKPAVSVRKSITDDYLICLDDGKRFTSMKRHLALLGMTPEEYRAKWGLPRDYPMVAPGYAAKRSELARATGLGSGRRKASETVAPDLVIASKPEAEPHVEKLSKQGRGRWKNAVA